MTLLEWLAVFLTAVNMLVILCISVDANQVMCADAGSRKK